MRANTTTARQISSFPRPASFPIAALLYGMADLAALTIVPVEALARHLAALEDLAVAVGPALGRAAGVARAGLVGRAVRSNENPTQLPQQDLAAPLDVDALAKRAVRPISMTVAARPRTR